ncbi:MAG: EamA family transporter [Clostridia bacterium]|nr:EamA family transporter [Clostridia bacterium]NCC68152.1 EamA family transporter [Clostridia bacterium]
MKTAYIKYFLALLLFGSNGIVANHIALNSYEIVLFRSLIGCLFLIVVFLVSGQKIQVFKNKRHFGYLIISGVAMGASWMFLYEAYVQVGVSVATLAYYCGPVIVMTLAPVIFREKITTTKIIGFIAVLTGMVFVNFQSLSRSGFSWGLLCGILSAVTYALMIIFNKKATSTTGLENTLCQLTASFFTVGLFILIKQGAYIYVPPQSIFPLLLLGIVNTGIGCYLYFSSIPKLSAGSVALCGYTEPASALIFSAVLLGERLTVLQFIGTALILGGAAFGESFHRKSALAAKTPNL